jgi:hypothetical protein
MSTYQDGMIVVDVGNPDRHAKILKAGAEVSEIRFDDDGAERAVSNEYLRPVGMTYCVNGVELAKPTLEEPQEEDAVRLGQEAWHRLRAHSTWQDWKKVGAAHVIGRTTAMRDGHVNKPKGRSYNAAFLAWQKKFGFDLDKGDRSRLYAVMDHLAEIEAWLATVKPAERLRLNHPNSVWRRWKKATAVVDPNKPEKVSAVQKLKDSVIQLSEECARMKREIDRGGGDLWTPDDRPEVIAEIMVSKLSLYKVEKVAREMLKFAKSKKVSA